MEAIRFTNTSVDEIGIDDSSRYPPDEFVQEDDPSRQYQANFYFSYYIIPHGRSLTELTQVNHVPEVIAPNEHDTPHTEDVEGNHDLINTEGTQEQNNLKKVSEALKHLGWVDAMQEELNQFCRNKVWTLVPLPYGKIAISSKWVFRNKKDKDGIVTKNKARLVAQGYSQEEGIDYDETFAPVARMEVIRIFLAFATYMNFIVFQMDVKSAVLNEKPKEEVYVKQPSGFKSSEFPDYVCKLDKALYKLKQVPRAWNIHFQEQYTRNLLKKYGISDSSSVKTLMVPSNNPGPDLAGKLISSQSKRITSHCCEMNLLVPIRGKLVCWSAKKQQSMAMSLAKAEYVAAVGCCANILWMKSQLSDYDIHYKMVPIFCDNTSAITISNNTVLHSRTKHIDIRYHFIRDHILKGDI
ncbi:retrovirus-related pol polyprotein from transposon TNT 1-94 [Tanacetum coccineum]